MTIRSMLIALAAVLAVAVTAPAVSAAPDVTDTVAFTEPEFGLFSGTKTVNIYAEGNPDDPFPGDGEFTYVYTVSNDATSYVSLVGVQIQVVPGCEPSTIGFFPGVADPDPPGGVVDSGEMEWTFATNPIAPGASGSDLYITSACGPSVVPDLVYSVDSEGAFFATGLCLGPAVMPQEECAVEVEKEGCVVQPPSPGGDACDGRATAFTFQYTGLGCDATSNLQSPFKQDCNGGADGDQPVNIVVKGKKKVCYFWYCWYVDVVFASETGVNVGDSVVVDAANAGRTTLGHDIEIKIREPDGSFVERDKFVVDCSQPLGPGNQFGSALITSLTSTEGGTVTLPEDEVCVKTIDIAPPPHCLGKVKELQLRYTGMACGTLTHSQSSSEATCTDVSALTTDPVRIIVSNGTYPCSTAYVDVSGVNVGDVITLKASDIGLSYFGPTAGFWIKDASDNTIQSGKFATDCDQPLNLGDQFGALQVFEITTTNGGSVALAEEVEYTYTVSNPNDSPLTNVSLDDDKLGNIASGVSIPAGGSETFTATALIEEDTTNTVTATGQVDSAQCTEATAQDTITVEEPPDPGMVCTTKVQAMLLRYTGPEILGATVEVVASNGWYYYSVVYDPIDLIPGVTVLSMPSENGYTIDAVAHGASELGWITKVKINGVAEALDTSCGYYCHCGCGGGGLPFKSTEQAPLYGSSDRSDNWFVLEFTQK